MNHRISDDHQRDLGLLLVGFALSRSERDRVLDSVPPGLLREECDQLLQSIRMNDPTGLTGWCKARGATLEKGKDVIQAVIDALDQERRRQVVRGVVARLQTSVKLLDAQQLSKKLRECADELDGLNGLGGE